MLPKKCTKTADCAPAAKRSTRVWVCRRVGCMRLAQPRSAYGQVEGVIYIRHLGCAFAD